MLMCVSSGKVFGPLHFTRHDLTVLTIMRGRDHGVLGYNSAATLTDCPLSTILQTSTRGSTA